MPSYHINMHLDSLGMSDFSFVSENLPGDAEFQKKMFKNFNDTLESLFPNDKKLNADDPEGTAKLVETTMWSDFMVMKELFSDCGQKYLADKFKDWQDSEMLAIGNHYSYLLDYNTANEYSFERDDEGIMLNTRDWRISLSDTGRMSILYTGDGHINIIASADFDDPSIITNSNDESVNIGRFVKALYRTVEYMNNEIYDRPYGMTWLDGLRLSDPFGRETHMLENEINAMIENDTPLPEDFTIPDGKYITNIPKHAFEGAGVKHVHIPNFITRIDSFAFAGSDLESITFDEDSKLKRIGAGAFKDSRLEAINLPKSVTDIRGYAFENTKLREFTLPPMISEIPEGMLSGCKKLEYFDIDRDENKTPLTRIGPYAFCDCARLASVDVSNCPNSMINIGGFAFADCAMLEEFKTDGLANAIASVGRGAFSNCALRELDLSKVHEIYDGALTNNKHLKNVELNENITFIGAGAFAGCSSLPEIRIQNVNSIGDSAFRNSGLERVLSQKRSVYSIGEICRDAFRGSKLERINLSRLENPSIPDCAFMNCPLQTVIWPNATDDADRKQKYPEIGANAFKGAPLSDTAPIPEMYRARVCDSAFDKDVLERLSGGKKIIDEVKSAIAKAEYKADNSSLVVAEKSAELGE